MTICSRIFGATSTGAVGVEFWGTVEAWLAGTSISMSGMLTGATETVPEIVRRLVCVLEAPTTKSVPLTPTSAVTVRI